MIKRRLILLGLWILSLVCISFYGGPLSYGFFFGLTMLPILSYVYLGVVAFTFKIYQSLESRNMVCDQMTDYYFVLQNDMPFAFPGVRILLFPDNFTVEEVPQDTEYGLLPGDEFTFHTRLSCKYRGEYEVGVKAVEMTDFLHIFKLKYRLPSTIRAIVAPKVVQVDRLQSLEHFETAKAKELFYGNDSLQAMVREYIPGDSMRLIHWKATARTGKLKVRRYEGENKTGIKMYFTGKRYSKDPNRHLPLENKILETALAITSYFIQSGTDIDVDVKTMGNKSLGNVSGADGFERFYGDVSEYIFTADYEEETERQRFCDEVMANPARVVFFVLHQVDEALLMRTKEISDLGMYVVIYLISDDHSKNLEGYCNERHQLICLGTKADLLTAL